MSRKLASAAIASAAATVRFMTAPLLAATRDPVVAVTLSFWSWVVNLMVAEWLVRGPWRSR